MPSFIGPVLPARVIPTGLYTGVFLSALFELGATVFAIGAHFGMGGGGQFNIGHAHFPLDGFMVWTIIASMIAITVGCRTGRPWARYAAVAFWILPIATIPLTSSPDAWAELAYGVGFAAIVAAYLFRNDAVEAYFARAELARASLRSAAINRALT